MKNQPPGFLQTKKNIKTLSGHNKQTEMLKALIEAIARSVSHLDVLMSLIENWNVLVVFLFLVCLCDVYYCFILFLLF